MHRERICDISNCINSAYIYIIHLALTRRAGLELGQQCRGDVEHPSFKHIWGSYRLAAHKLSLE